MEENIPKAGLEEYSRFEKSLVKGDMRQKIWEHVYHAIAKHPEFCNSLDWLTGEAAGHELELMREAILGESRHDQLCASTLLDCEIAEMREALAKGDMGSAREEAYDAIAVLLRMIVRMEKSHA